MNSFDLLKNRFEANMHRHPNLTWTAVAERFYGQTPLLNALDWMESTGGEPDVLVFHETWILVDMVRESPSLRTNCCFDEKARLARKKFPPQRSVESMIGSTGVGLIDEELYRYAQTLEAFDLKTSSWVATPETIRSRGGALFMDRRYDQVFVYHNGADSYYGGRGFRTSIKLTN